MKRKMNTQDRSYLWTVVPLIIFVLIMCYLLAPMAKAVNVIDRTPLQSSRATPSDTTWIAGGVIYFTELDSAVVVVMRVNNKMIVDTVQGVDAGDTTRILGTMFSDTVRVGGRAYFGWDSFNTYLDSALVDSLVQQLGRFAPGGAGTGDIEGVIAGAGLIDGGITGTVTLNVAVGTSTGLGVNADSVFITTVPDSKIATTITRDSEVHDSLDAHWDAFTEGAADSNAQVYGADRYGSYTGSGKTVFGDTGDSCYILLDSTAAQSYAILYASWHLGEAVVDSMIVTRNFILNSIGDSISGLIRGVTAGEGLIGGASQGEATLSINWPWLYDFIDTSSAKIATASLADSANGGAIRAEVAKTVVYSWLYGVIDTSSSKIPTASLADSATGAARSTTTKGVDANGLTEAALKAVNTAVDEDILTYESTTGDFEWHTPSELGLLTSETGDISSVVAGNGLTGGATSGAATLDIGGSWSIRVTADSIHVKQLDGDSITAGTVADARIATSICRDAEVHDSIWAAGFATKANVHDSIWAAGFLTSETGDISNVGVTAPITGGGSSGSVTVGFDWAWLWAFNDTMTATVPRSTLADSANGGAIRSEAAKLAYLLTAPQGSANTFGRLTGDSIIVDTAFATRMNVTNLKVGSDAFITDITGTGLSISTGALTATLGTSIAKSELDADAVDSTKIGDGGVATADLRDTLVTTGKLKNASVTPAKTDSSQTYIFGSMRTPARSQSFIRSNNFLATDNDSVLKIGSASGLIISSAITLGTDITDDTLVVDYYPEYVGMVLADAIMPMWKDSIKIYGYVDTVAGMGNTLLFSDSVLTSGLHRRGIVLAINHPMRVDSLRYIIVQGLVKDSSGTNSMYLKGMLRTSLFRGANVDSNAASHIKDYDSLGGDYTDNASIRQFVLSGGAITEGSPWYLLLIARHVSGTAHNWAQVGRIRAVYSRTRL